MSATATRLEAAAPDALVSLGFGFGVMRLNEVLSGLGWSPPRYTGTAWQDAFVVALGSRGVPRLGGARPVRRGEPGGGGVPRPVRASATAADPSTTCRGRRATSPRSWCPRLAEAKPLSPRGVCEALERVKMLPAASGAPGTRISYGKWTRRGWMGTGYLVARQFDDEDPMKTHYRGRLREPKIW